MYFSAFPKIYYDAKGDDNPKVVTNLLRRVAIRTKVKNNVMLYNLNIQDYTHLNHMWEKLNCNLAKSIHNHQQ